MRWIGISLLVATLGITCIAQESQPASVDDSSLRIAENPKIELQESEADKTQSADPSNVPPELQAQPRYYAIIVMKPGERPRTVWVADTRTIGCYSLRVYQFERDDTEAPEMTGETTCTPSDKLAFKKVNPRPKARLVPAN